MDHCTVGAGGAATGTDDPEFKAAWAMTNLRPMWGRENISKGAKRLLLL